LSAVANQSPPLQLKKANQKGLTAVELENIKDRRIFNANGRWRGWRFIAEGFGSQIDGA
jgi:hypothetical protein